MNLRKFPLFAAMASVLCCGHIVHGADPTFEDIEILKTTIGPVIGMANRGDGYFYGASRWEEKSPGGAVFRIAPGQPEEVLYTFPFVQSMQTPNFGGSNPSCQLIPGSNGDFLGATDAGGAYANGTIYRIFADGTFGVVCNLPDEVGKSVFAILLTSTGELYGVSSYNGAKGGGTLFQVDADGRAQVLYTFDSSQNVAPGQPIPPYGPTTLREGPDHKIYGTTYAGGGISKGFTPGTFFRYDSPGAITVLADFGSSADVPGSCVPTTDGFFVSTDSNLYHLDLDGTKTYLATFGAHAALLLMPDGLYGLATTGGTTTNGFVFRYTQAEGAAVLYNFGTDYYGRARCLVAGNDGLVYGLAALPEGYVPPASSNLMATRTTATMTALTARTVAPPKARTFRFRQKSTQSANFVPVAKPDEAWLPATTSFNWSRSVTIDVIVNDRDRDKNPLTLTGFTPPAIGTVKRLSSAPKSKLVFTTTDADPASQMFCYQITDSKGGNATGFVAVRSAASGKYTGTPLDTTDPTLPTGPLTLNVGTKNVVNVTAMLGSRRFTGKGEFGVEETADLTLTCSGQPPLNMHLTIQRRSPRKIEATFQGGGSAYTAVCQRTGN